jgi:hypothetical protein
MGTSGVRYFSTITNLGHASKEITSQWPCCLIMKMSYDRAGSLSAHLAAHINYIGLAK